MNVLPTIAVLHRETGLSRAQIATVIESHGIETADAGPAKVVTPEGMTRLMPILEELQSKARARRERKATASA